jgi:hypothetical protein
MGAGPEPAPMLGRTSPPAWVRVKPGGLAACARATNNSLCAAAQSQGAHEGRSLPGLGGCVVG